MATSLRAACGRYSAGTVCAAIGERGDCRRWGEEGAERVAGTDGRRSRIDGKENIEGPNRTKERKSKYADVVELVDSVDLGSSVFDVQVRVLSSAP